MVELQGGIALRVAAQGASSSGFLDQDALDLPPPGDDPPHLATGAAEAVRPPDVPRRPVTLARQLELADPLAVRGSDGGAPPGRAGLQVVTAEPMPDGRRASAEDIGHVADRQVAGHDLGEQLALDRPRAAWRSACADVSPCLRAQ